jgi:hypothetical protein
VDRVAENAAAATLPLTEPVRDHEPEIHVTRHTARQRVEPEYRDGYAAHDDELPGIVPAEPPRSLMFPVALGLILGLLVGFAAGYAVFSRQRPADVVAAVGEGSPGTPAQPTTGQAAAPDGGKPYSEQTVAQPPSTPPPTVPEESPQPAPAARPPAPTAAGRIVVRSTPSNAGVMVNGEWSGRTPLTIDKLALGAYSVRVVQDRYVSETQDIRLTAGQPARTLTFRLERTPARAAATPPRAPASQASPMTGSIYVDSRPRGARVLIDGKAVGATPISVPDIRIGSHVVRLELDDHRPWTTSTRVSAGDTTRVTGSLERIR